MELTCARCGKRNRSFAYGLKYLSWEAVLAEIEKCEVVCANCHRRRTARRGEFRRWTATCTPTQRSLF